MKRDELFQGVRECLGKVADLDLSRVKESQRVVDDLGLDSLDMLDLVFQLERQFKIKISPRDIERRAKEKLGGMPLEKDGVYTPQALDQLKQHFPKDQHKELKPGLRTADFPKLFRVSTFMDLVSRLREEQHGK